MPRRDAPAFFDKCNCLRLSPFSSSALANAGRRERRLHTVAVIILNQAGKVKTCHTFFAIPARKTFRAGVRITLPADEGDTRPGRCCDRDARPGRCNDNGPGLIRGLRTRLMKGMRARADATFCAPSPSRLQVAQKVICPSRIHRRVSILRGTDIPGNRSSDLPEADRRMGR